jgi:hypothetical protein
MGTPEPEGRGGAVAVIPPRVAVVAASFQIFAPDTLIILLVIALLFAAKHFWPRR